MSRIKKWKIIRLTIAIVFVYYIFQLVGTQTENDIEIFRLILTRLPELGLVLGTGYSSYTYYHIISKLKLWNMRWVMVVGTPYTECYNA